MKNQRNFKTIHLLICILLVVMISIGQTSVVLAVSGWGANSSSSECIITLSSNRDGFEDTKIMLPENVLIPEEALSQPLNSLKTSDGKYKAYGWCKDEECTDPWDPNTDLSKDGLVLYADWGYSFEYFLELIDGRHFLTTDRKNSLVTNCWKGGKYSMTNSSGGYSFTSGKLEKIGNVYSLYPNGISGTASYTMDGDIPVSLTYKGDSFKSGTYSPCWQVYCDPNGGQMSGTVSNISVFDGDKAEKPDKAELPYRENYTFIGWFTEKDGGNEFDFSTPIHADLHLYAHWYRDYTVTFDDNFEGGKTQQVKVEEGKEFPTAIEPMMVPAGCHFNGWYKDNKCEEEFTGTIMSDITVYAGWELNDYIVSFDVQGHGTNPDPIKVRHGDQLIYNPTPSCENYIFKGWYRNKECTYRWSFTNHTVTEDITLYACWEKEPGADPEKFPASIFGEGNVFIVAVVSVILIGASIVFAVLHKKRHK